MMKRVTSLWKTKDNQKYQKPYENEQQQHNPDVKVIPHVNSTLEHVAQETTKTMVEVKPNLSDSVCESQQTGDAFVPVAPPRKKRKNKLKKAPPPPINSTVQNKIQETNDEVLENHSKIGSKTVARIESFSEVDDDLSEFETVLKKEMLQASRERNLPRVRKESQSNDGKIKTIEDLYATVNKKSKTKTETYRLPDYKNHQEDEVVQSKNKILDNVEQVTSEDLKQDNNRRPTVRLDIQLENTDTVLNIGSKDGPDILAFTSDKTGINDFSVQDNEEDGFDGSQDDIYDVLSDARNCRTPHRKAPDVKSIAKLEHNKNEISSNPLQDDKNEDKNTYKYDVVIYENVPTKERESEAIKLLAPGSPLLLHAKAIKAELESKWKRNGVALYENVPYEKVLNRKEVEVSEIDGNIIKSVQKKVENSSDADQSANQVQAKTTTSTNELENSGSQEVKYETNSDTVLHDSKQKQVHMRIRLNSEGKLAPPKPLRKSMERLSFTENSQTDLEATQVLVASEQPTAKPRINISTNSESKFNNEEANTTKIRPTAKPRVKLATGTQEALNDKITYSGNALININQDNMHINDKSVDCNSSIVTDVHTAQHSCSEQSISSSEITQHQEVTKPINIILEQDVTKELLQKLNDISKEVTVIDKEVNSDHLSEEDQLLYYDSLLKLSAMTDAIKGKNDVQVRTEKKALLRKIQELADILDNK